MTEVSLLIVCCRLYSGCSWKASFYELPMIETRSRTIAFAVKARSHIAIIIRAWGIRPRMGDMRTWLISTARGIGANILFGLIT